jgi:hypothetical protein
MGHLMASIVPEPNLDTTFFFPKTEIPCPPTAIGLHSDQWPISHQDEKPGATAEVA